ncbi:MAG: anti-sigma factor [Pseudomonas sp.]|uniref:anti-sigma factor n=1 Tax=Pseudomonas sp. TaxID=306 RepID=UPI0027359529|nr:anti-sigma factor [Pseudomonas sp.]MDP3846986.1 anti-sigma factor [Pseudomonas sp.]
MNTTDPVNPQELDLRIAEYVLGVLDAKERAEVADLIASHPRYAAQLSAWQQRLGPLTDEYDSLEAPSFIWSRITHALQWSPASAQPRPTTASSRFWSSLAVWRGLTAGALAASLILAGVLIVQPKPASYSAPLTAALQLENGAAVYTATVDAQRQRIVIIPAAALQLDGRVAELWFISPGAAPRSLGLLHADLPMSVAIPDDLQQLVSANTVFAISLEPAGGSPTQQPTGPVVAKGNIFSL